MQLRASTAVVTAPRLVTAVCTSFCLVIAVLALPRASSAQPEAARPATILLVRHAEKAGTTGDVSLSAPGQARAVRLASMLKDADVTHIFTSELLRTRATAAPLARQRGLTSQPMPGAALDDLVAKLRALPAGAVALVVHHSNTVPKIAERLGVAKVPPIKEDEFDRLLVITRSGDGVSRLLTLRY
ncbi:MAG TPA: histidine phosphatase family protein [Polyangia bacterium]